MPTFVNLRAPGGLASHEVPHPDGSIAADTESDFAGRMNGNTVDFSFMTFERP